MCPSTVQIRPSLHGIVLSSWLFWTAEATTEPHPTDTITDQSVITRSSVDLAFLIMWVSFLLGCVTWCGFAAAGVCFNRRISNWLEQGCSTEEDVERVRIERRLAAGKQVRPPRWYHCYQGVPTLMFLNWMGMLCPIGGLLFVSSIVAWSMTAAGVDLTGIFVTFGSLAFVSACIYGALVFYTLTNVIVLDTGIDMLQKKASDIDASVSTQLRAGAIRLLSCRWLRAQGYAGALAPLSRQQDLPEEAFLTPEEATEAFENGHVYVLSYGWLTPAHPDPHALTLRIVVEFLQSHWLLTRAAPAVGLFWDFASLPQKPRTDQEDRTFKAGLAVITNFYGSLWQSTVIQLKTLPSAPDGETYNERQYSDRGWCVVEEGVALFAARHRSRAASSERKRWEFPKLVDISEGAPKLPDLDGERGSVEYIQAALARATFTSSGDREEVTQQLKGFNTMLSIQRHHKNDLDARNIAV